MCILSRNGLRALVLVLVVALPGTAGAEQIAITAGHVDAEIFLGLANVVFQGDGFLLDVGVEGFRHRWLSGARRAQRAPALTSAVYSISAARRALLSWTASPTPRFSRMA
jgi:hypothetical protein